MRVSYAHTISCGHRIVGHPGNCRMIHGHNYEIIFHVDGAVGDDGMVVDYAELKKIGKAVEREWDHRLLLWECDPIVPQVHNLLQKFETVGSVKAVPFNPTAENIALYLLDRFQISAITVKESPKTSAHIEK